MAAAMTTTPGGDSFRRYLEESGAVDVISTGTAIVETATSSVNGMKSVALASLYEEEERPDNAIE